MERLSGLDASFLYLETRSQLMHIVGVFELDTSTVPGGYSYETFREQLAGRVDVMAPLRRKVHDSFFNIDHPVWVEDENFSIDNHVHHVALPSPGGERELAEFCAHIAGQPLDRSKPLWDLWVIESATTPDAITVALRLHHAGVDGVTASELLMHLCSPTPEVPAPDGEAARPTAGGSHAVTLAAQGAFNVLRRPMSVARALPETMTVPLRWITRAHKHTAMAAPFAAPRTPFNGHITARRSIAFTRIHLDDIKRIKNHFDVKLNDVVLAVCAGALREYLLDVDALPNRPLTTVVPVSVHDDDDRSLITAGTNRVTSMFAQLPTDVADAGERVLAVRERVGIAKEHHAEINSSLLRAWAQVIPANTANSLMRLYAHEHLADHHRAPYNLVISNVAGPAMPLYFLGARVTAMYPLGPIFHSIGLNLTVFSVDGQLNVGVIACQDMVPDAWPMMKAIDSQVAELLGLCP